MLFVATTINYVDRQVLSILKPILHGQTIHLQPLFSGWPSVETTINVTDREYGYIAGWHFRWRMRWAWCLPGGWWTGWDVAGDIRW